jgi:tRNA dimethylallyltransferase
MEKPIIVITGPTASGKTAMSLEIAGKYNGEIICADSMTVYRGMDIGTDKPGALIPPRHSEPSKESRTAGAGSPALPTGKFASTQDDEGKNINGIRHHLLDIINPDEEFNVAIFVQKVRKIIDDIHARGKIPFIVGGSLMYIDALIYDYRLPEVAPNSGLREELNQKTEEELFSQLCELDPDCEWTIDKHNKRRLIRAIEVCLNSEKPFSQHKTKAKLPNNVLYLSVDREREELYQRINERVDEMFKNGFVREVQGLLPKFDHNTAMQAAGYRQICDYLDDKIDLATAIEKTKQVHRNFAKRQLTWLCRNPDVKWIKNKAEAEHSISAFLRS